MKQEVGPELCKASLGVLVWRRPWSCALACFLLFDCPASLACWSSSELQPCSLFASLSRLCPAQCVCAEPLLPRDSRLPLLLAATGRGCPRDHPNRGLGLRRGMWSVARTASHPGHSHCLPKLHGECMNLPALVLTAMPFSQHRQGSAD